MAVNSVITPISSRTRKNTVRETDEFEGLWLNPGIEVGDEKDPKFLRLPRGIAVSDLKPRKIYESMDPDFATETAMMNDVIQQIQDEALKLGEGESIVINMPMRIYRRQEESEITTDKTTNKALHSALFGKTG